MVDVVNEVAERFFSLPLQEKKSFDQSSFLLSYDFLGKAR